MPPSRTQLTNTNQLSIQQALDRLRSFISAGWGKVKVTAADPVADYLRAKLIQGANITLTVVGTPGYEQIRIDATGGAAADEKVKVDAADTTAGFLQPKLVAGPGIGFTVLTPGGNEQLEISATGSGSVSGAYIDGGVALRDAVAVQGADTAVKASAGAVTARSLVGFVTAVGGGTATVQYAGEVSGFVGLMQDGEYWLDVAAGLIVPTAPFAPGRIIRKVGVAKSPTVLVINIEGNYTELA